MTSIGERVLEDYNALIEIGFTQGQAHTIIASQSIAAGNASKSAPTLTAQSVNAIIDSSHVAASVKAGVSQRAASQALMDAATEFEKDVWFFPASRDRIARKLRERALSVVGMSK